MSRVQFPSSFVPAASLSENGTHCQYHCGASVVYYVEDFLGDFVSTSIWDEMDCENRSSYLACENTTTTIV